jgi:hypothetical protein
VKAPATLLCLALAQAASAVDPERFKPYAEAPFGPYRAQVCDRFLEHERIIYPAPALTGGKLDALLARCPTLLDIGARVRPAPSGAALYELDIDNDGAIDQVLYLHNLFRHLEPESYHKLDLARCRLSRIFGAARRNRLFTLDGQAYIESVQRCKGPVKVPGGLRHLNCALIYKSDGRELEPYRDELCVFIERAWRR